MSRQQQTADDLAAGREYIEKHGWTKYNLENPNGTVCTIGGIIRGIGLNPTSINACSNPRVERAARALLSALRGERVVRRPNPVCTVTDWNDDHADNIQQVLDLMAKAEKIERNDGVDPDE